MSKIKEINKSQIVNLLKHLNSKYEIFHIVKKGNIEIYEKFDNDLETENLHPPLGAMPVNKFFIPNNDLIIKSQKANEKNQTKKQKLIFGVSSFDIQALNHLDQIMSVPHRDQTYFNKRKNTIIIGIGHERINIANKGYDVFLEDHGEKLIAIGGNNYGEEILENPLFTNSKLNPKKIASFQDPLFGNIDKIQKAIKASFQSKIWKELAKTCFGCGICSYVCPLCYCYEHEDYFSIENNNCSACRQKRWDACFLPDFFAVSGHNFRPELPNRIYNWYHHKFVRMPKEYGFIGCVDCGRCIEFCPAKINFKKVIERLIKEYA